MVTLSGRILGRKNNSIKAILSMILVFLIITVMPVAAQTSTLHLQCTDLAPKFIYTGSAHAEELNEIVMLQIEISTNTSEQVNLKSISVRRTGIASDADVEDACLFADINHNGVLEHSNDTLLSTSNFQTGRAKFNVQLTLNQTAPLNLLIALNISGNARSGATIGLDIPGKEYIDTEGAADVEFALTICSKNSTVLLDTDGDLNPDTTDQDDDNDGYTDEMEMICGSDTKDSNDTPKDTDKDQVPDSLDTDDDNDGEPDKYDDFPLDKDKQRDYSIIYAYALIAVILIFIIIYLGWERKPKGPGKRILSEEDIEDEFAIDTKEPESKIEEEMLEGKDEELLEE